MSYKFEEGKDLIINAVIDKIMERMPEEQALLCIKFVQQFYGTVAYEELADWDIEDLYGSAVNFWSLLQHRGKDAMKIHIYNPEFERHGWQTTHSVIEIVTRDMPFIVDSLRIVVNRMGLMCYLVIHTGGISVKRDINDNIIELLPRGTIGDNDLIEAPILMEIDRQTDEEILRALHVNIANTLNDVRNVCNDWRSMRQVVLKTVDEIDSAASVVDLKILEETKLLLSWLEDHHFTFLGTMDYALVNVGKKTVMRPCLATGLGLMRVGNTNSTPRNVATLFPRDQDLIFSSNLLVMSKTNIESTIHRQTYMDYIGIKLYNKNGQMIGERRIIGLCTSSAYNTSPRYIPFLRHKVELVMKNSNLNPYSHAGKVLLNILETLPRDDLIQATEEELLEISMGIYYMQDRPRIRLFVRPDRYQRFVSCFVYVPKDQFNVSLSRAIQNILSEAFNAIDINFSTWFPESSVLARIHFMIRTNPDQPLSQDYASIEQSLITVGRSWIDELKHFLFETYGEEKANNLFSYYKNGFPAVYCDNFLPRTAVNDIKHVEELNTDTSLVMNFYHLMDEPIENFRLKVYRKHHSIPLSDVLPIMECLGMRAISERPYMLHLENGETIWISDFSLQYIRRDTFDIDMIKELFQNAFSKVWFNEAENDKFNQLVLAAGLNWREVSILRAYAKYFKQIRFTFSQEYIESALNNNPSAARKIVELFHKRFSIIDNPNRESESKQILNDVYALLEDVTNLDEDKIIRQYIQVIMATLRTNYYQNDKNDAMKSYLSFKIHSAAVPGMPKPYPKFEIFIYSPRFEGVHLRCDKVARGGLRWSDRREDFRTEILGLMKAQQVKNSVIVPSGAKGGFVPKRLPINGQSEDILNEAIVCYKMFIRGLLDITDNYHLAAIVKPQNVICYDDDDPYLVVAADKGTANFSDLANEIALEYGFWLGDAFASGGSLGYNHKQIRITSRGVWESVKCHFHALNINIETTDFTVIGIGDMSGDVFGNGMLLSRHIKLIAAFDNLAIFIDPDPDPELSYKERERMFNLPRSRWHDYDKKLISKGGGIFYRNAKSILVSKEMKTIFDIKQAQIEPNELIRCILRSHVDLLWSGGIGTFVKAQTETNSDVGDRTNDSIRINANDLGCRVVAEGGNLGFTQLARVEYELNGGLIFTDFIDNSAGVNCSDKEVNIKILLNLIMATGDLTFKQRNELLASMTNEVADLVLNDNFIQTISIIYLVSQSNRSLDLYSRYINDLEQTGKIDRGLEFLPNDKMLMERKLIGKGLTGAEIAVLLCYGKTLLKEKILKTNVPEDPFLQSYLIDYFPAPLKELYANRMHEHPLRREIIATTLSNLIINQMGSVVVYRMQYETGAPISAIVRSYMITLVIIDMKSIWKKLVHSGCIISVEQQNQIMMLYTRLVRRIIRWFLRNQRMRLNISKAVKMYSANFITIKNAIPAILGSEQKIQYEQSYDQYLAMGVGVDLAHELAVTRWLFSVIDIIDVAHKLHLNVTHVAELYFKIGDYLDINWIRSQIIIHPTENTWESLSREALRDDLDWQQRHLTEGIIKLNAGKDNLMAAFSLWTESHVALINRWRHILIDLRASTNLNYTMFFVAIRELLDLTQMTIQMTEST